MGIIGFGTPVCVRTYIWVTKFRKSCIPSRVKWSSYTIPIVKMIETILINDLMWKWLVKMGIIGFGALVCVRRYKSVTKFRKSCIPSFAKWSPYTIPSVKMKEKVLIKDLIWKCLVKVGIIGFGTPVCIQTYIWVNKFRKSYIPSLAKWSAYTIPDRKSVV